MMAVGEQTAISPKRCKPLPTFMSASCRRSKPFRLCPPVIIVLIAIVVGFVVYSILSAVFEMTHSLQVRPT
jgi:hypothetical protein